MKGFSRPALESDCLCVVRVGFFYKARLWIQKALVYKPMVFCLSAGGEMGCAELCGKKTSTPCIDTEYRENLMEQNKTKAWGKNEK